MNALSRLFKLCFAALVVAVSARYGVIMFEGRMQDRFTENVCDTVSLPLETGLVRQTYEGIENALKANGERLACVSVIDSGRSFSPSCLDSKLNYRMVACRAKSNSGMLAAVYYPQQSLFSVTLLKLWSALVMIFLGFAYVLKEAARYMIGTYSDLVSALSLQSTTVAVPQSWPHRLALELMDSLGIAQAISHEASEFRKTLNESEEKIRSEILAREKLEIEADQAERFREKVERIHHDIRSPISSLNSVHEKLSATDGLAGRAVLNAIKRIQVSMDDLRRTDDEGVNTKLVVAEVIIEEVVALMIDKFSETKSAQLDFVYDNHALSPIMVDPKAFHATIENLVENALDAIQRGGAVRIEVTNQSGRCVIAIEDDGCGISDEALSGLGQKSATVGKLGGTGIGLYHANRNLRAWGGTLKAERLPQGTRFTLSIPLIQCGAVFTGLPLTDSIVVIDDDKLVPDVLRAAGFDVVAEALSFENGEELLSSNRDSVLPILVDQRIGNRLGTDLIAGQVRRSNLFLCTNEFDNPEVIMRAKALGVKIVPKPLCFTFRRPANGRLRVAAPIAPQAVANHTAGF